MACMLVAAAFGGASAASASALGLGGLLPIVTHPSDPPATPAEPADPEPGSDDDGDAGQTVDGPADDPADDDAGPTDPKSIEPSAKPVGKLRARGLSKLRYVVSCPQLDCIVSVDVRIKVPGDLIEMSSQIALIEGDDSRGFTLGITRSERKLLRRAARGARSVKVVARVVEWSGSKPKYGKAFSTKIR